MRGQLRQKRALAHNGESACGQKPRKLMWTGAIKQYANEDLDGFGVGERKRLRHGRMRETVS